MRDEFGASKCIARCGAWPTAAPSVAFDREVQPSLTPAPLLLSVALLVVTHDEEHGIARRAPSSADVCVRAQRTSARRTPEAHPSDIEPTMSTARSFSSGHHRDAQREQRACAVMGAQTVDQVNAGVRFERDRAREEDPDRHVPPQAEPEGPVGA